MKTKKIAYILTPLSIAILVVFHTINIYAMKIDPASNRTQYDPKKRTLGQSSIQQAFVGHRTGKKKNIQIFGNKNIRDNPCDHIEKRSARDNPGF